MSSELAKKYVNEEISLFCRDFVKIRSEINENDTFGFHYDIITFIKVMKAFTIPQVYGNRIPKFMDEMLKMQMVSLDSGGDRMVNDKTTEIKTTICADNKKEFNYRQVRLFEKNVEQYFLPSFCLNSNGSVDIYPFMLTKEQMREEIINKRMGSSCHKRAEVRSSYEQVEYGILLKVGSDDFTRWMNNYFSKELKRLINKINQGA